MDEKAYGAGSLCSSISGGNAAGTKIVEGSTLILSMRSFLKPTFAYTPSLPLKFLRLFLRCLRPTALSCVVIKKLGSRNLSWLFIFAVGGKGLSCFSFVLVAW